MGKRGIVARKLAEAAGFVPMPVMRVGMRITSGYVLELGPDCTADEIVTAACRRTLGREGVHDEREVAELVRGYGYVYSIGGYSHGYLAAFREISQQAS